MGKSNSSCSIGVYINTHPTHLEKKGRAHKLWSFDQKVQVPASVLHLRSL